MNYLDLCQFAHRYIQGGDDLPGTAPLTVVGQTGFLFELVKNVAFAYQSIQNEQSSWRFMQKQGSFALASGQRVLTNAQMIAQIPLFSTLQPDLFGAGQRFLQMYPDSAGPQSQTPVSYVDYQTWRGSIDQQPLTTGRPSLFTIRPDEAIEFNSTPTENYHFLLDYYREQDEWVQVASGAVPDPNLQVPIFPVRFHQIVAWRAVMLWAASIEVAGKYGFARDEYNRILNDMVNDQLPETVPYYGAFGSGYAGAYF